MTWKSLLYIQIGEVLFQHNDFSGKDTLQYRNYNNSKNSFLFQFGPDCVEDGFIQFAMDEICGKDN